MKNKRKKDKFILFKNDGTTMLETIISFVVLTLVLTALYAMIRFSSNLRMRAIDSVDVRNSFNTEIYKEDPNKNVVDVYNYVGKHAKDKKTMFSLKVNSDTSAENLDITNGDGTPYNFNNSVRLPNVDAIGYVSKDSRVDEENLACPKVLMFYYNEKR